MKLGATLQRPPQDQFYGDRDGFIVDPFGHGWTIATHVEDVAPDEMMRRLAALQQGALAINPSQPGVEFAGARDNVVRVPGLFGPELSAPSAADEQTCWLAYLGRAAWQPATASAIRFGGAL